MGALIAVFGKRAENATEKAIAMLKTLRNEGSEAFGIASPFNIRIERTLEELQCENLNSSVVIGHVFSRIVESDQPQPVKLEKATVVFEGRTYPPEDTKRLEENVATELHRIGEKTIRALAGRAEGDFAFVLAEPKRLIAGRDSLGVRPLYYGENKHVAALASERKALWRIGVINARSFPPGHIAVLRESGLEFESARALSYREPERVTMQAAASRLQELLGQSVKERTSGLKDIAVAFSGGLDSSIIAFLAKQTDTKVHLLHTSLENQPETEYAEKTAEELDLPIHVHLLKEDDIERVLSGVLWWIEESGPINASIGIPVYWTAEKAAEMRFKVMLTGQCADEFFGGYQRYADDYLSLGEEQTRERMRRDIITIHKNNLERDFKICNSHNVESRLPFATHDIAGFASGLPINLKIEPRLDGLRKLVLRQAARNLGLPDSVLKRPKKAIQYATGVDRALRKLAKHRGLSVKEFLEKEFQKIVKKRMQHD